MCFSCAFLIYVFWPYANFINFNRTIKKNIFKANKQDNKRQALNKTQTLFIYYKCFDYKK